jgi:uncharacterized protein
MMHVKKPSDAEIASTHQWGTWSKEPSTFSWVYDEDETCYILEGEASVKDNNGNSISFNAGDWVEFKKGLSCVWTITKAVKKKYLFG